VRSKGRDLPGEKERIREHSYRYNRQGEGEEKVSLKRRGKKPRGKKGENDVAHWRKTR